MLFYRLAVEFPWAVKVSLLKFQHGSAPNHGLKSINCRIVRPIDSLECTGSANWRMKMLMQETSMSIFWK